MAKRDALKRLLKPASVALFGGAAAAEVIHQCAGIDYDGALWPVHPERAEIAGRPCFRSVAELPGVPDAAFIAVGPATTVDIVAQLRERGAAGAVCYAAGFAEAGAAGVALQSRLRDAAGPMAIVGPNCHGFINYLDGVALWPDAHGGVRSERGAAFVLQSGNIGISITMQQRDLPISYMITVGNMADLGMHDYIDALLDDPRVTAIGLYVEGIDHIDAFSAAAARALRQRVPIVVLKSGSSALGAEAAKSHTSSLAGSDELSSALFERLGIVRSRSIQQFVETLKFLSIVGPLRSRRIASMSCSGGEASLVADAAERIGLQMPEFSESSREAMHRVLGDRVHIANPLDYHTYIWGDDAAMTSCFTAVMQNQQDCTLLVLDYPRSGGGSLRAWETAENALIAAQAATGRHAVMVSTLPENLPAATRRRLADAGIAPMQGLDECLQAIADAAAAGGAQGRADRVLALPLRQPPSGRDEVLDEWHSKRALAAFGLAVPEAQLCAADQVVKAAGEIGYPVCLKIVSTTVTHKSDVGGVALHITDEPALAAALHRMRGLATQFLVEKMAPAAVAELIVGIKRDPQFGLALLLGAGGILVELLQDTATLLLPVSREDILAALSRLRVAAILGGFRGQRVADVDAATTAIQAIATYAEAHSDSLLELDVNPLLVLQDGALAVDAMIRLRH